MRKFMSFRKAFVLLAVALILCISITVIGATSIDRSKTLIGFVKEDKGHPVVRMWQASFLSKAKEVGYNAELYCGETTDISQTVTLAEQGLAKGVKGIVTVAENTGYYPFIKKASDAGVPVVMCHTIIQSPDAVPGCKAFVACDNFKCGANAAIAIGKKLGGKGTVAITQGGFNNTENNTAKGFVDAMKQNFPKIKILDIQLETYDPSQAVARQVAILQSNPDVTAAFSTTGTGPSDWAKAAEQAKRPGLVIIGMDYIRQNLDLVKEGKVYAVMGQPVWEEVQLGVVLLDKLLHGEKVPFANLLPAPVITKDKLAPYYAMIKKVEESF
jgi:ribose transport system substrate-binding protein